jgi:hypothetical protein
VVPDHVAIRHRPETVGRRTEFGHWEGNPMIFRKRHGAANVATAVERTTRCSVLLRSNDRCSKPIMPRLIDELAPLPAKARRGLTSDRGLEFVSWRELDAGRGAKAWLGRPPGPLVRANGGEHQRPPLARPSPRHRPPDAPRPSPQGHPRPPRRHPGQVPRMAHPRRGVPRPPPGAYPARARRRTSPRTRTPRHPRCSGPLPPAGATASRSRSSPDLRPVTPSAPIASRCPQRGAGGARTEGLAVDSQKVLRSTRLR